jgi:hypothetical protein
MMAGLLVVYLAAYLVAPKADLLVEMTVVTMVQNLVVRSVVKTADYLVAVKAANLVVKSAVTKAGY